MRKGFTLVEILAVVIIIGVLGLLCVPVVDSIVNKNEEKALDKQKQLIIIGLKNWGAAHVMVLPDEDNETRVVTLSQLQYEGFVDKELKNPINDKCFSGSTELVIKRVGNNYDYSFYDEDDIEYTDNCHYYPPPK